jgi:DNA invertase Pin-like site-specific DNA recombinase
MSIIGFTAKRTFTRIERLLDNPLYLLEKLNDSRARVFLLLREAGTPIHISQIHAKTHLSRMQVYRALTFLRIIGLAAELHGYWYEKNPI